MVFVILEEEYDENTDELLTEAVDLSYYKDYVEKNLPEGGSYEKFNGTDTWKYGDHQIEITQYSEFDIVLTFIKY